MHLSRPATPTVWSAGGDADIMRSTQIAYVMCSFPMATTPTEPYTAARYIRGPLRIAYPGYADHQLVVSACSLYP